MRYGTHRVGTLLAALVFAVPVLANEKAEPDPARSPYWEADQATDVRRPADQCRRPGLIRVYLNMRADRCLDRAVAVKSPDRSDRKGLHSSRSILIRRTQTPLRRQAMFHFTPSSGRAQVETRLRFEDFSFVRAIAEMNDGKLYMSQRWVKAAGGCSAPNARNFVPEGVAREK